MTAHSHDLPSFESLHFLGVCISFGAGPRLSGCIHVDVIPSCLHSLCVSVDARDSSRFILLTFSVHPSAFMPDGTQWSLTPTHSGPSNSRLHTRRAPLMPAAQARLSIVSGRSSPCPFLHPSNHPLPPTVTQRTNSNLLRAQGVSTSHAEEAGLEGQPARHHHQYWQYWQ